MGHVHVVPDELQVLPIRHHLHHGVLERGALLGRQRRLILPDGRRRTGLGARQRPRRDLRPNSRPRPVGALQGFELAVRKAAANHIVKRPGVVRLAGVVAGGMARVMTGGMGVVHERLRTR